MAQEAENGSTKAVVAFSAMKPQLWVPAAKAADAIQFFKDAFGAEEVSRALHPKRKADQELPLVLSAELKIGPSVFIVCDQTDESEAALGYCFCLETGDVDGAISRAVKAGATLKGEITDGEGACCGARSGEVKDPFGNVWAICSPAPAPSANA